MFIEILPFWCEMGNDYWRAMRVRLLDCCCGWIESQMSCLVALQYWYLGVTLADLASKQGMALRLASQFVWATCFLFFWVRVVSVTALRIWVYPVPKLHHPPFGNFLNLVWRHLFYACLTLMVFEPPKPVCIGHIVRRPLRMLMLQRWATASLYFKLIGAIADGRGVDFHISTFQPVAWCRRQQ